MNFSMIICLLIFSLPLTFAISVCDPPLRVTPESSVLPHSPQSTADATLWIDQGSIFANHTSLGFFPVFSDFSLKYDLVTSFPFLAWMGYTPESQIFLCRLNSSYQCPSSFVLMNTSTLKQHLAFDGRYIVWEEYVNQIPFLRGCDLVHPTCSLSVSFLPYQKYPSLDRHILVWQQYIHSSWQIFLHDFFLNTTQQLTIDINHHYRPQIRYPYVFWHQYNNTSDQIFVLDLRTSHTTVLSNASYKLTIDFGTLGIKRSSAQITTLYIKEALAGKHVIAVTNFPPKQIANFLSECLVLGVVLENKEVVLLQPERAVPNGYRIA